VSHHLKQLVDAGLLTREQRGRWSFYRVVDGALDSLAGALRPPGTGLILRATAPTHQPQLTSGSKA